MHSMKGFSFGHHKAATALMHAALSSEPIPTMGPPSPPAYVSLQFDTLGITSLTEFSSLQTCRPARYPSFMTPNLNIVDTSPFLELDVPAPSVVSSISAQASQDDKTHAKWHRDCWCLIKSASKSEDLKLPRDKSKFPSWERIFVSGVRGTSWSSDSCSILQHATTTSANAAASKDLASLLNKCAIWGGDAIYHELLGGPGQDFLHNNQGIELRAVGPHQDSIQPHQCPLALGLPK
jgi:hypothetical protein